MEKWLIQELKPEIYKMSLEHLGEPESKEVFRKTVMGCVKGTQKPNEGACNS